MLYMGDGVDPQVWLHEFLWRCSTWRMQKCPKRLGSEIVIQAFFEKLEYYRSEEYEPYEG